MKRKGGAVLLQMTNLPVNGLSHKVRTSLMKDLEQAVKDKASAVVLMGAGNHFSAGADIAEFARGGHRTSPSLTDVIDYMDAYTTPLVAGIHGTALGGGLETALACHWRVANGTALVGLPEVKLGILPGAGGTQRLPRLTGVATAIDIMTTGRMIASKEALSLGIIDKLLDTTGEEYVDAVVEFALSEQVQTIPIAQRRVSQWMVPGNVTEETFRTLYEDVKKNAKGATYHLIHPLSHHLIPSNVPTNIPANTPSICPVSPSYIPPNTPPLRPVTDQPTTCSIYRRDRPPCHSYIPSNTPSNSSCHPPTDLQARSPPWPFLKQYKLPLYLNHFQKD